MAKIKTSLITTTQVSLRSKGDDFQMTVMATEHQSLRLSNQVPCQIMNQRLLRIFLFSINNLAISVDLRAKTVKTMATMRDDIYVI